MPGNPRSGRTPDITRPTYPKADGEPIRPDFAFDEAGRLWDAVVPWLVKRGLAGACDSAMLQAMCEQWALYRACIQVIAVKPENAWDKDIRVSAASYLATCEKLAGRYGLTFADRARLRTGAVESDDNPLAQFGVVG
jgi:phage terminase small subunit